jgi:death-on-curing protein
MTDYLTVVEVLAVHDDQIERYGGAHGVRDPGLLEAALFRPQTGYYADVVEEAVALWESLSQNHPSLDGNKRTAFAAAYTFLAINGGRLTADANETYLFVADLYETNEFRFERLVAWLRGAYHAGAWRLAAAFDIRTAGTQGPASSKPLTLSDQ